MAGARGSGPDEGATQRAARRLLRAAVADGDSPRLPDAFASRVAARAFSAPAEGSWAALGAAAWRLLPVLATLVLAVAAWTGYETARLDAAQETTLVQAIGQGGGDADAVLAVLLLGGDTPAAAGDRR